MDKYLESLVRKGEAKEEPVSEVNEEEVVQEIEDVLISDSAEPVVEESELEVIETESEPEPVVEEKKPELKKAKSPSKSKYNEGETISVTDIRIFNVPDIKTVSKIFSGNVIINGRISDMYMIEYVKPGFGLVKGFTPDLK